MRSIASFLLFLTLLAVAAPAQNLASPDSARLRTLAHNLLATGSPEDAARAADLLQRASEIDARDAETLKSTAERKKLDKPDNSNARWTTLATAATPLLTTMILAGTLIFQIFQARVAEREKREDSARQQDLDEKKRLADALELIQKSEDFSPAAALINTFNTEPYRTNARHVAAVILLRSKTIDKFTDLFTSVFDPVTEQSLPEIFAIMRSVDANLNPLLTLTYKAGTTDFSALTPTQLTDFYLLVGERDFLSARVAPVIRRLKSDKPLDLHQIGLSNCDLSGADLHGAILSPGAWNFINVDGCDLSGISEFQYTAFYNTSWWHAERIEKAFLDYLKANHPYVPGWMYNTRLPVSPDTYAQNLSRLEAQTGTS